MVLVWADARLHPQLHALAAMQALASQEHVLNSAVLSALDGGEYGALIAVQQNERGQVTSIQTDALQINILKGRISEAAASALAERTQVVAIPAGSLTGLDLLAGRGPAIRVPVRTSGYANAEIESVFEDAGINQTIHRLLLQVHAEVCLSMSKTQQTKSLTYAVSLAETVIVGEVPALYAAQAS